MATAQSAPVGRFVWYDLMTTDPAAAQRFYTQLFGWTTQPFEGADPPYIMWVNDGDMIGGVSGLSDEMRGQGVPPHWIAATAVADVDRTAERAGELGGSVLAPPMDIPGTGRYAVLADPQGIAFSIFAASEQWPGTDGMAPVGVPSWHELGTTDPEAAWTFYRTLFGWEDASALDMGPEVGTYQMFGRNGTPIGAIYRKRANEGPPAWLYYTRVPDADRAAERVKELGGQVIVGPMEVPGGDRVAICFDPQGGVFAVHAPKSA